MSEVRFRTAEQMAELTAKRDAANALLDEILETERQVNALMGRRTALLAEFDDVFGEAYTGHPAWRERSLTAEVACALHVPERTAESLLGFARLLTDTFPATFAALQEGRIDYLRARELSGSLAALPIDEQTELEALLLPQAEWLTLSKFRARVHRAIEARRPEKAAERHRTEFENRDVWVTSERDGMAYLTAYLSAVDAQAIWNRLDDTARQERLEGESRTAAQLRSDVLVAALLDRVVGAEAPEPFLRRVGATHDDYLAAQEKLLGRFAGIVPTVLVTVPVMTYLGCDDALANLEGIGPIDPVTARKLTAQAPSLYRMLTDPHTGEPLAISPENYRVPQPLRYWLRVRDGCCRFPVCSISTRRSDLDHTHDFAFGGRTLDGNLAHLSRGHHTLKHHGGWRVSQRGRGVLDWVSPLGREYTTHPA